MKITKTHLSQIIQEELNSVLVHRATMPLNEAAEQQTIQAVETGNEMIDTPVGEMAFKALDDSEEFQRALQQIASQANKHNEQVNEQDADGGNTMGQFALLGGVAGLAKANVAMTTAFWSGVLTKSLGPAAFGVLKALGIGVGAAAGGMVLAAVAGYLLSKGIMKVL